jgi:hypothetical protein
MDQRIVVMLIVFALDLVFAFICAKLASSKNRHAGDWFFIGLFTTILGLAILACLPRLNPKSIAKNTMSILR